MKKRIIWVSVAIALLVLGITLVVRSRRRTAEAELLKKRSNAIADLINERDAKIADLERTISETTQPQQQTPPQLQGLVAYPENPRSLPLRSNNETELVENEIEVEVEETNQQQDENKKAKLKPAQKKSIRVASEEERVQYGFLTHQLAQVSDEEKVTLYKEFLNNPKAKVYKGIIAKQLNSLLAKMNKTV